MSDYKDAAAKLHGLLNGAAESAERAMAPAKPVQATVSNVTAEGVYVKTDGDDTSKGPFPATIMPKLNDRVALTNLGGTWTVTDDFDDPGASGTWVRAEDGKITQRVDEIRAGVGKFDELYATTATVSVLVADNADIEQLNAAQAEIERLRAQEISAQIVMAPKAQFDDIKAKSLESETGTFEDITVEGQIVANIGRIDRAEVKRLNADVATFGEIGAKFAHLDNGVIDNAKIHHGDVIELEANYAHITDGVIDNAEIGYADVKDLDANYADINFANVEGAKIGAAKLQDLFAASGWFNKLEVTGDADITGQLTAVEIDGDTARFKNIYADALKLLGSDGLYRALNLVGLPSGEQQAMVSEYGESLEGGLHGSRIIAESITAEQINVESLLAATLLAQSVQMGATGGMHFESNGDKLSFMSGNRHLDQYEQVTTTGTENPSIEAWYELVNGRYVPTEDATVASGKTYYYVPGEIAYITANKRGESVFYMTNAIVVRNLNFGQWRWRSRENGNLNLKWMGASS